MANIYFTDYEFVSVGTDRWSTRLKMRCENLDNEYICIRRESPAYSEPREYWSGQPYSGTFNYIYTIPSYPNMVPLTYKVRTSYIPTWADTLNITTPGTITSEPTAPVVRERLEGGARFEFSVYYGSLYTEFKWRREGSTNIVTTEREVTLYGVVRTVTLRPLYYGTRYYVSVRSCSAGGCSPYSPENPFTVNPKTPTASAINVTPTSITIAVSDMSGSYMAGNFDNINISGWKGTSSSGTSIGTKTITKAQYDASNRTVTFSGLTPDQDYYFEAQSNITVSGTTLWSLSVDTVHAYTSARPNDWTWTTAELSIFNNGGDIEDISYLRWNDFVDRVNEFAVYCGVSQLPSTVKMSSSDRTLYASDFKAVAQKIHDMSGAVASELRNVSSGDDVDGWYFPHLATALSYIE